jgi:hypothetical protein
MVHAEMRDVVHTPGMEGPVRRKDPWHTVRLRSRGTVLVPDLQACRRPTESPTVQGYPGPQGLSKAGVGMASRDTAGILGAAGA